VRDEDKWPAIHVYRSAVANGDAPVIVCPDCQSELVPVVGQHSEPELKCFACRTVFGISIYTWDQIRANIGEIVENLRNNDN